MLFFNTIIDHDGDHCSSKTDEPEVKFWSVLISCSGLG